MGADEFDWYLDHVVVPGRAGRHTVGPVRQWRRSWDAAAARLGRETPPGPWAGTTRLALSQGFVVTRAQALAAGLAPADLRRRVARSEWTRCGHGIVAIDAPLDDNGFARARRAHALAAAGAALSRPGHVVSAASAAIMQGLPTVGVPDRPELLARTDVTTGRRSTAHVRRPPLSGEDVEYWFGVPVTTVARTVVDLARFDPASGLMAADAALHESLVRPIDIRASLASAVGFRWIRRARDVLALASPLIESPLESLTHLALHGAGFPAPLLQAPLRGADGRTYRADFYWPHARLVLEADGRGKYEGNALWAEKIRERALTRAGYRVVRVVWSDVTANWADTECWLRAELRRTR